MPAQAWVTLIIGGLATAGALATRQQKNRADKRSEWWRRATWALERTFSNDNAQQELGWMLLASLVGSRLATKDDSDIVQVISPNTRPSTRTPGHESATMTTEQPLTGASTPPPETSTPAP